MPTTLPPHQHQRVIAHRLNRAIKTSGLSLDDIAWQMNMRYGDRYVSRQQLYDWKSNRSRIPSEHIATLEDVLPTVDHGGLTAPPDGDELDQATPMAATQRYLRRQADLLSRRTLVALRDPATGLVVPAPRPADQRLPHPTLS